jgi:hypothetical protein
MIRFTVFGSAVLLSLAACAPPAEPVAPVPAPQQVDPGPPVSIGDKLTPAGYGPLRIGMTHAQVEAALGPDSAPGEAGGPDPAACDMFHPARAPDGLMVMVEDGVLTSVWITRNPSLETDRGLNIGDTAVEVKRVYGAAAEVAPHEYQDAPAEYLTVWSTADHDGSGARGLKYDIGSDGKVQSIAGGGPSIQYVEGCA